MSEPGVRQQPTVEAADTAPGVSVVIACCNGAARLPPTLQHLAAQQTGGELAWEVVLVDNGSTDRTAETARRLWDASGAVVPLRVVDQPTPGTMAARLAGIRAARYADILFCDDDNWLAPDYMQRAHDVLAAHPAAAAVGGQGEPEPEGPAPAWLPAIAAGYALGPQANRTGPLADVGAGLYGAGLIFRKQAVEQALHNGHRFCLSGRHSGRPAPGEDSELTLMLALCGWELRYEEALRFRHFIPSHRLTWPYVTERSRGFGAASVVLDAYTLCLRPHRLKWAVKSRWVLNACLVAGQLLALACRDAVRRAPREGDPASLRRAWYRGKLDEVLHARGRADDVFAHLARVTAASAPAG